MEKKDMQIVDFKKMPVDYSSIEVTDAALAKLKEEYGEVPDCSTKEGYAIAKAGLAKFRSIRSKVEARRKELNSEAVDYKKRVDTEAKRIIEFVVVLEEPMKEARKAEDAIKEEEKRIAAEKERERVAAIEKDINTIRNVVLDCHGKTSLELSGIIESLDETPIEMDRFAEHTPIAEAAKIEAIGKLIEMRDQAVATEKADEERKAEDARLAEERKKFEAEQTEAKKKEEAAAIERAKEAQELAEKEEKLRKKQDEELAVERKKLDDEKKETQRKDDIKAKIQAIKDRGAYDPEATAEQLEGRINVLKNLVPNKEVYEEFTEEAFMAIGLAIASLQDFYVVAMEKERLAAVAAKEAAKAEEEATEQELLEKTTASPEETEPEVVEIPEEERTDAVKANETAEDARRLEFVNAMVDLFPSVPMPTANHIYRAIKNGELPHVRLIGGE